MIVLSFYAVECCSGQFVMAGLGDGRRDFILKTRARVIEIRRWDPFRAIPSYQSEKEGGT